MGTCAREWGPRETTRAGDSDADRNEGRKKEGETGVRREQWGEEMCWAGCERARGREQGASRVQGRGNLACL